MLDDDGDAEKKEEKDPTEDDKGFWTLLEDSCQDFWSRGECYCLPQV